MHLMFRISVLNKVSIWNNSIIINERPRECHNYTSFSDVKANTVFQSLHHENTSVILYPFVLISQRAKILRLCSKFYAQQAKVPMMIFPGSGLVSHSFE